MNGRRTRWTKQLKVILDIVYESPSPLTADGVYRKARRKIASISLGTVYRNLNKLVTEGLVAQSTNNGITTFSRHPFPNTDFECRVCYKLVTVPLDLNILELNRRSGFKIERYALHLSGICPECDRKCT